MMMNHIFLYGPPGAGKSTLGKVLAGELDLPFVDLDCVVESNAHLPIPQIMESEGEAAFRDLETAALREVTNSEESVVALGGGCLLRDENRMMAEKSGTVVMLMADLDTLLNRLGSDSSERPLLAGDKRERLASLLANRAGHYRSFPLQMDAARPLQELAAAVQSRHQGVFT